MDGWTSARAWTLAHEYGEGEESIFVVCVYGMV